MAAPERAPANVGSILLPVGEGIEELLDDAMPAPQHEQRALDAPAAEIGVVVREIDAFGGAVVLAGRMDRRRIAERAHVLGPAVGLERREPGEAPAHELAQV